MAVIDLCGGGVTRSTVQRMIDEAVIEAGAVTPEIVDQKIDDAFDEYDVPIKDIYSLLPHNLTNSSDEIILEGNDVTILANLISDYRKGKIRLRFLRSEGVHYSNDYTLEFIVPTSYMVYPTADPTNANIPDLKVIYRYNGANVAKVYCQLLLGAYQLPLMATGASSSNKALFDTLKFRISSDGYAHTIYESGTTGKYVGCDAQYFDFVDSMAISGYKINNDGTLTREQYTFNNDGSVV